MSQVVCGVESLKRTRTIAVLGAGLAGLSLAYNFAKNNLDVIVLEATDKPGGLLKSINIDGYTFDIGGSHIIFSKDKNILNSMINFLGRENLVKHYRNTFIYYNGSLIKYPFENGIYALSPYERYIILKDIIETYIKRGKGVLEKPKNLYEWFIYVFGKELSRRYLIPYNEKIWKRDLRSLSLEWVKGRVPHPPLDDIIKSAVGIPTEGYKHQINFFYPLMNGIEFFINKLVYFIKKYKGKIYCKTPINRIDHEDGKFIISSNNKSFEADYVFSTIPLTELINLFNDVSNNVRSAIDNLDYNSLIVVGIGVKGSPKIKNIHWIYFPQKEIIFHRIAFLSNYSPNMAPRGSHSIIAEISYDPRDKSFIRRGDKSIINEVIDQLSELKLLNEKDVEVYGLWRWKYAYIVYNQYYSSSIKTVLEYINNKGIYVHGRFGSWKYLNMDHIWKESMETNRKFMTRSFGV
ncbi:MAG: FAD-dependent oxidoreductase [Thermoprotei archaeon]|nr:MAG: FAD-dependent oxidoreductase [Thermoprotei archaeon]